MLLVPQILASSEADDLRSRIDRLPTRDGGATAGGVAGSAKDNRELSGDDPEIKAIGQIGLGALNRSPRFKSFALPHKIRMPIISIYDPGMVYGDHVDAPVMGEGPLHATRTDLSVTLFLSDPASYDGGELLLRTPYGDRPVKAKAGDAICYPTSYIHGVRPVTRGRRVALVTWLQSRVRNHDNRSILYDLERSIAELPADVPTEQRLRLGHVYARLMQQWVEM